MDRHSDTTPLLDLSGLPRFAQIRPEQIEPALDTLLAANRADIERVIANRDETSWDGFVGPIEDSDERLDRFWSTVSHLHAVADSAPLRTAYEACLPKLVAYQTAISQDPRIYAGYHALAGSDAFAGLDDAQRKIVENALRDFRLAGVELEPDAKTRFKEISQELSALGNRFENNLLDATNAWSLQLSDERELTGLPDSAIAAARQNAERDGLAGWKFTLHAPSWIPFVTYADDPALRRKMYEAYTTRASDCGPDAGRFDNSEVMVEILRMRAQLAALLGFDHYAGYSLATKMADSVDEVYAFLGSLADTARPVARQELAELREFAGEQFGIDTLEVWDLAYYSEKLRQARFDFTQEQLRPYFPLPRVLEGMFEIVRRLFGMSVRPAPVEQTWHDDVRFFEITDAGGEMRGRFYVDLYARPGKRGGAWMADCVSRKRVDDGGTQIPVAFLTCNFTLPIGDRPALLTHEEVITLFHEFGHGLHHMLTRVDYVGVAGINGVKWDAVELPSQFLENWCWEREALDILSGHVDTDAPLPDSLLDKMRRARNFHMGMQTVRQLEFSLFDLRLHSGFDPTGAEAIQALLDDVRAEVAVLDAASFNRFQHSFSHIFGGGYAAGYYGYKWAEVLSADAFSVFEENGVFDTVTGASFLHHILEAGGVREPLALFRAFRGRAPTVDALLRHCGLAA